MTSYEERVEAASRAIYELVEGQPMPSGVVKGVKAKSVGTGAVAEVALEAAGLPALLDQFGPKEFK